MFRETVWHWCCCTNLCHLADTGTRCLRSFTFNFLNILACNWNFWWNMELLCYESMKMLKIPSIVHVLTGWCIKRHKKSERCVKFVITLARFGRDEFKLSIPHVHFLASRVRQQQYQGAAQWAIRWSLLKYLNQISWPLILPEMSNEQALKHERLVPCILLLCTNTLGDLTSQPSTYLL